MASLLKVLAVSVALALATATSAAARRGGDHGERRDVHIHHIQLWSVDHGWQGEHRGDSHFHGRHHRHWLEIDFFRLGKGGTVKLTLGHPSSGGSFEMIRPRSSDSGGWTLCGGA